MRVHLLRLTIVAAQLVAIAVAAVPGPAAAAGTATGTGTGMAAAAPQPRHCAVEPMMTLRYQVAGLALNGSAPPGRQVLTVTAGHLQLVKGASITGATVQVSFDGGKTWHPASVTALGNGSFRAVFSAPAGASVTLRTTAHDAAGGSIAETITSGYAIGG